MDWCLLHDLKTRSPKKILNVFGTVDPNRLCLVCIESFHDGSGFPKCFLRHQLSTPAAFKFKQQISSLPDHPFKLRHYQGYVTVVDNAPDANNHVHTTVGQRQGFDRGNKWIG